MIEYNKEIKLCETNKYYVFCDKKHPLVNKSGWVYYHRHVMSMKIGRWLKTEEHVHHIDGNRMNNELSNLELLSVQEHMAKHYPTSKRFKKCKGCKKYTVRTGADAFKHRYCSNECWEKFKCKIVWPTVDEMRGMVFTIPMMSISKKLGVSDVAVKKFCKRNGIETPKRGHWVKFQEHKDTINYPTIEQMRSLVWEKSMANIAKDLKASDSAVNDFCKRNGISTPPKGFWNKKYLTNTANNIRSLSI